MDETTELDADAVGFHITDLDVGIAVMASFDIGNLGVYLAGKLDVHSFGLVGIDGLTAEGAFDIALNVGFGLSGLEPNLDVIDFDASFNELTRCSTCSIPMERAASHRRNSPPPSAPGTVSPQP